MLKELLFASLALYLRNTHVQRGRFRLLRYARPLGREVAHRLGKREILTHSGFRMEIDLADWIPQDLFLTGEFEPEATAIAKRLLGPGDTAIDVGANIGYFTLLFSKCVGSEGRVVSFEPVPDLATQLKRNLDLNQYSNVTVKCIALSDRPGMARFYVGPRHNTGLSSLRRPRAGTGGFEVQLTPLDELDEDWGRVKLIKIDVEGAELKVLRGMERLLKATSAALLVEVTDEFLRAMGDSADALIRFLSQLEYECHVINEGQVTRLNTPIAAMPKQWNALFIHRNVLGGRTEL